MKKEGMLAGAMAIFGTLGLFVKYIPIGSAQLALCRAVLAATLVGLVLLLTRQGLSLKKLGSSIPWLLCSGAALGINWILLFEAYRYTSVANATLSYYFAPVIVTALCPVLFREKLTSKQVVCFVGSTLGLALITGSGGISGGRELIGIGLGLGAAVFYATVVLLNKKIKHVEGLPRTFLQFVIAAAVMLPYVLSTEGLSFAGLNGGSWALLLTVGLVHTGFSYCLYFSAIKDLPGQKTAILSYLDPLIAVALSVLVLRESISGWQLLGGGMILGFTLYSEL